MKKLTILFLLFLTLGTSPKQVRADVPLPTIMLAGSTKTEFRICKIRRLFCGKTAVLIISIAIFTVGFLMVLGKLNWGVALFSIAGIVIFYNAEAITRDFQKRMQFIIVENPLCNCKCPIGDNLLLELIDNPNSLLDASALADFQNIAECTPNFGGSLGSLAQPWRNTFVNKINEILGGN